MTSRFAALPLALFALVVSAAPAFAVDGVILIDQNRAIAGNITPGDAPGFPISPPSSQSTLRSS